jgi:hypothetical protein
MIPASSKRRRLFLSGIAGLLAILSSWAAADLFSRRAQSLRDFNPSEVARLDTTMWRSYYAKQHLPLYFQLTELLRKEYHLPWLRSQWVAYQAAKAAFVFKEGRSRNDYEKALPHLRDFYSAISAISDDPFDMNRAAELELEWWIVHREREKHSPEDLPRLLAQTAAVMYHRMSRFLSTESFAPQPCKFGIVRLPQADLRNRIGARSEACWIDHGVRSGKP